MNRTPPPKQPNGFEKSSMQITIKCTPTEKLTWLAVFGRRKLSEEARDLLNRKAARVAKI